VRMSASAARSRTVDGRRRGECSTLMITPERRTRPRILGPKGVSSRCRARRRVNRWDSIPGKAEIGHLATNLSRPARGLVESPRPWVRLSRSRSRGQFAERAVAFGEVESSLGSARQCPTIEFPRETSDLRGTPSGARSFPTSVSTPHRGAEGRRRGVAGRRGKLVLCRGPTPGNF